MSKEAKELIAKVSKLLQIPKDRHPEEVPDDALAIGKSAGVIKVWAQNGPIYDVKLADGTMQKIHQQDLCVRIFKMIAAKQEKEAGKPTLEEKAEEVAEVMDVVVDDGARPDDHDGPISDLEPDEVEDEEEEGPQEAEAPAEEEVEETVDPE